jgi:hypothetical protein
VASPKKQPVAAPNPRGTQAWDYATIRAAINEQLLGRFDRICSLSTALLLDSAYSAALNKRINGLIRSSLAFEAYDVLEPGAALAVDLCSRYSPVMLEENEFRACLRDYHNVGAFLGHIEVEVIDGKFIPCLRHLDPRNLRWDAQTDTFLYRDLHGQHVVAP